jgi:hypothetical protein
MDVLPEDLLAVGVRQRKADFVIFGGSKVASSVVRSSPAASSNSIIKLLCGFTGELLSAGSSSSSSILFR